MGRQVAEALDALRNLGTPDEMRVLAQQDCSPRPLPPINAHVHLPPNFSAFESVEQAVNLAADQGLAALGVSNYYDYDVYGDFVHCARHKGIFPLFGTRGSRSTIRAIPASFTSAARASRVSTK
jgi:hypothetical protein